MAYQRGSLKQVKRKAGFTWILRYRITQPDRRRVEHTHIVGLVADFPKTKDALREVDRLGLITRINDESADTRIHFDALAEHYLKTDFGQDAVRPKSVNTIAAVERYSRNHLIPRWGKEIADEIKPLDLQRWLKSLRTDKALAWTTIAKLRGIMLRIYKIGIRHELVTNNPVLHVETRSKSNYRAIVITPQQTLAIIQALPSHLHSTLVLTCAATALRASEILSLRWADILWSENRIRVNKRWAKGADGETKTDASDGYVPMHPLLAYALEEWHQLMQYGKETEFVFPSLRAQGTIPVSASVFCNDHLRPAAIGAGVLIPKGSRFGLHNLRHSLSNWLVNKAKVEPKTVQAILRHSKIQTTLDLYTQKDADEARAAQGEFLNAVGIKSQMVQ
jgi:integrase